MRRFRFDIKKYFKVILAFVLGFIIAGGLGYAAVIIFNSNEVGYVNTTSGLNATDVQGALDEINADANEYSLFLDELNIINQDLYPVGSIYISTSDDDPRTMLFGGTWEVIATGRTLVGIDTSQTEFNAVEKTGGHKALASHTHPFTASWDTRDTLSSGGSDQYRNSWSIDNTSVSAGPSGNWSGHCQYQGSKNRGTQITVNGTSGATGAGGSGNLQPYITVYMWKRTA